MLDPNTGNITDFISLNKIDPEFRPIDIKFSPEGDAMYVVSYGKVEIRTSIPKGGTGIPEYRSGAGLYPFATIHATVWPFANTGVVWKVTPVDNNATDSQ